MTAPPPLPLAEWRATKDTLHVFCQIAGKIRMAYAVPRNHWWHATLRVSARGLCTRLIPHPDNPFELEFDLQGHGVELRTARGTGARFPLRDGLSVAEFQQRLLQLLRGEGIEPRFLQKPYDLSFAKAAFAEDRTHANYDPAHASRFAAVLHWVDHVFEEFAARFGGKTSPVQFFWHSFDLAVTRFSGRTAPRIDGADPVEREAYSHEVASFGFWPGDDNVKEPAFYGYAAPAPDGIRDQPLQPASARWNPEGGMALLTYEDVRRSSDPRATLLAFLESVWQAASRTADWAAAAPRG